jgi:NhaP-type Na+/H+ or K+/H+ antiporter
MNIIATVSALGCVALGLLIGWMIRYAWKRIRAFTMKTLSATLSLMLGGLAARLVSPHSGYVWLYVFGLLGGFVLYSIVAAIAIRRERRRGEFEGALYEEE